VVVDIMIAALLMTNPARPTPTGPACTPGRELSTCETQLFQNAVMWRGRALTGRARWEGCQEKLAIRTSSAAETLSPCPPPPAPPGLDWGALLGTTAGALLMGVVVGVMVAK
jgi:predicted lipid-binding transport protein (Tim44 family)